MQPYKFSSNSIFLYFLKQVMVLIVPDHVGGRPIEVNACILITHMVYL